MEKPVRRYAPRRGRPTAEQVEALETSILSVAREMFLANGYAATSMEAVAVAAGVSKATLYARYSGKPSLLNAIASDRLRAWEARDLPVASEVRSSLPDVLFAHATTLLRNLGDPEVAAFHRLIVAEAARFPELARSFASAYELSIDKLTAEIEANGQGEAWPLSDTRGMALAFTSAILGWWQNQSLLDGVGEAACARFASRLTAIFMSGRTAW